MQHEQKKGEKPCTNQKDLDSVLVPCLHFWTATFKIGRGQDYVTVTFVSLVYLIDPLHCSLLRMRDKAMSARVAIKRSSYYRNEWQITRKASFFRITTAKFFISEYTAQ